MEVGSLVAFWLAEPRTVVFFPKGCQHFSVGVKRMFGIVSRSCTVCGHDPLDVAGRRSGDQAVGVVGGGFEELQVNVAYIASIPGSVISAIASAIGWGCSDLRCAPIRASSLQVARISAALRQARALPWSLDVAETPRTWPPSARDGHAYGSLGQPASGGSEGARVRGDTRDLGRLQPQRICGRQGLTSQSCSAWGGSRRDADASVCADLSHRPTRKAWQVAVNHDRGQEGVV